MEVTLKTSPPHYRDTTISTYSVDKWITLHEVSLEVEKDRVRGVAENGFLGKTVEK